jgi:hypothetical protein
MVFKIIIARGLTSRQPSNAGCFRKQAVTKPTNVIGNENIKQVNPALRLPAGRYAQII